MKCSRRATRLLGVLRPLLGLTFVGVVGCAPDGPARVRSELVTASGRPFEGRLIGTPFAPCTADPSGRCRETESGLPRTLWRHYERELDDAFGAMSLHRNAVWKLLSGDRDTPLLSVVRVLETAIAQAPTDARLHNDLAVVLSRHGLEHDSPWHLIRALEAIEQAREIDAVNQEARFNQALILERLHLRSQATAAWQAVATHEDDPAWADEARSRAARLREPTRTERWRSARHAAELAARAGDTRPWEALAAGFPKETYFALRDEWLAAWAARDLGAMSGADTGDAVQQLAATLANRTGDHVLWATTEDRDAREIDAREIDAMRAYARGIQHYRNHCYVDARHELGQALGLLDHDQPFRGWVAFFDAVSQVQSNAEAGEASLRRLLGTIDSERSSVLRGRIHWVLGIALGRQGRLDDAIAQYREAHRHLGASLGPSATGFVDFLIGEALYYQGHRLAAWRRFRAAFATLAEVGDGKRRHSALRSSARLLLGDGLPRAARRLLDEAVANAEALGNAFEQMAAHLERGRAKTVLEDLTALDDFARARRHAADLACDTSFHAAAMADIALAEANVTLRRQPELLEEVLDPVIRSFTARDSHVLLARALALRGSAWRALGRPDRARADLTGSLERFRTQLVPGRLGPEPSFVREAEAALAELVEVEIGVGEPAHALAVAERFKIAPSPSPMTREQALAMIARPLENTVIVAFLDLDDSVLRWRLDARGLQTTRIATAPAALRARVARVVEIVQRDGPSVKATLQDLHQDLLDETLAEATAERLVFIPDRSLAGVPFAALRRPDGRYLIETFSVEVASGLAAVALPNRPSSEAIRALVLGDPKTGHGDLAGARDEARTIARIHGEKRSMLLLGSEATDQRFMNLWHQFPLVHVAAHSTIDVHRPYRWQIHLASSDPESTGDITPERLYVEHSGTCCLTRLLVLSSCSSALDGSSVARAPYGIAGAFLTLGVPTVIGTLWPVADDTSLPLMRTLHVALARGIRPANALQQAQRAMLRADDPRWRDPRAWSGFRLLRRPAAPRYFCQPDDPLGS